MIPEIRYHAILAQAPITEVSTIINNQRTRLVKCDRIMFFRPLAQTSVVPLVETPTEIVSAPKDTPPAGTLPTVALLDGYPMQNHDLLAGRLIVDDPDGWEHTYRAGERCHGTSMASLIIHGELGKGEKPLGRPIYVRPILRPDPEDFVSYPREECIPRDCLPVDLIHRAVKRILDGDGTAPASAPSVCFINLSVGDRNRPFHRSVSPWARLLDWLSEKYGILFLVSAGNHPEPIALEVDCKDYNGLFPDDLETQVLRSIAGNIRSRRILSPGEAINPLTIGAFHSDTSDGTPSGNIVDPFVTPDLPSPVSGLGLGYNRSIKPDVLFPGGRQTYRKRLSLSGPAVLETVRATSRPPGLKVAAPGPNPGQTSYTCYTRGTSNSAALATRTAALLYDNLLDLVSLYGEDDLPGDLLPVLVKALIVHGSSIPELGYRLFQSVLMDSHNKIKFREYVSRFYGYGIVDSSRLFECTQQRVTLIGCNSIKADEGHVYSVPLPPCLSGSKVSRRLIITLAWFSPINPANLRYRVASLWFDPPREQFGVERQGADHNAMRRGTVQHDILEGSSALAYVDGTAMEIKVNCREDGGTLRGGAVRYGIVVTLEVPEFLKLPLYEEVRERIRPMVRVTM
ncbi:MAG TPA: S8 family peptidase [Clostridia bacterium]|nr:S8 family peptidase [Clostridia bacterium]